MSSEEGENRQGFEASQSSLKRSLQRFRDDTHRFQSELSGLRAEVARLRAERDELRKLATKALADTKDFAILNIQKAFAAANQSLLQQRVENSRMRQDLQSLKYDRNALRAMVKQEQQRLQELQERLRLLVQ